MQKLFLAVFAISILLLSSCEEETIKNYRLTEEVKSMGEFKEGSEWTYNIIVDRKIPIKSFFEIIDTIGVGDTTYNSEERVIKDDPYREIGDSLVFESVHTFMDSVYLFGEYRVISFDTLVRDTVKISNRNKYYYTDDTLIFRRIYYVFDTLYSPEYNEVLTLSSSETQEYTYQMGTSESTEEVIRNTYTSSLNTNELIHDVFFASSNGSELFKRDIQPNTGYYTSFALTFYDGVLDTTTFTPDNGTYFYNEISSAVVEGKTYNDVQVIKSKYEISNHLGNIVARDIEYWRTKKDGVIRIHESETNTTYTLTSSNIK